MKFFDSNIQVAMQMVKKFSHLNSEKELLDLLDEHSIDKALVLHASQRNIHPEYGNKMAVDFFSSDRVEKVFAVLPPVPNEFEYDVFDYMKTNNFKAITAYPVHQNFLLNRISMGKFFDEVSERKIPLLLSLEEISWQSIYELMRDYPKLTVILTDLGAWAQDRYYYPLLTSFENVKIETDMLSLEAGGLETAVKTFGSERFIFGSSYPRRYITASKMDLLHCRIPEEDKENIAYKNLEKILGDVVL